MKVLSEFTEHLQVALRKMCNMVGADPDKIDFKSHNWFWQYTWTKEQEQEFIQWFADYLYNNTKARQELLHANRKNKKYCRKAAEQFVWNYGWKERQS